MSYITFWKQFHAVLILVQHLIDRHKCSRYTEVNECEVFVMTIHSYHYMPEELITFNGSAYVVDGVSFSSEDEAWEYAANWGYLSEPAVLRPDTSDQNTPDYAA